MSQNSAQAARAGRRRSRRRRRRTSEEHADEWKKKIDSQKEKIDGLSRDLDLEQREYRLRAAAMYADAGNRLRNPAQWEKEDAQYKSDVDSKQKAIETARQQLDECRSRRARPGCERRGQKNSKTETPAGTKITARTKTK